MNTEVAKIARIIRRTKKALLVLYIHDDPKHWSEQWIPKSQIRWARGNEIGVPSFIKKRLEYPSEYFDAKEVDGALYYGSGPYYDEVGEKYYLNSEDALPYHQPQLLDEGPDGLLLW